MKRIDYHVHTALSGDNTQTAEQLGKAALERKKIREALKPWFDTVLLDLEER